MTQDEADQFAAEWVEAWNAHDLDAILAHYAEDIEFSSPFAVRLLDREDGTVRGLSELREYFRRGLEAYPELRFRLVRAVPGVRSVALQYRSVNDLEAVEVMELGEGKVRRVLAHYSSATMEGK